MFFFLVSPGVLTAEGDSHGVAWALMGDMVLLIYAPVFAD